jgi:hypothetical protein
MANALSQRAADGTGMGCYRQRDQGVYKAFQTATGALKVDGFPGTGTMTLLQPILAQVGVPMPPCPIYPWKAAGGWNHPNAPTLREWQS